ncbi:MAG: hypothetical protein ACLFMO_00810 [Eubacteriales bacterium]
MGSPIKEWKDEIYKKFGSPTKGQSLEDTDFEWETTTCLHKPYWDKAEGNIEFFYELRETWIKGFVENISGKFKYTRKGFEHMIRLK